MASYHLDGEALIWFQDVEQAVVLLAGRSLSELCKPILVPQPMMIQWKHSLG